MIESLTGVINLVIRQKQKSHTIHLLRALPLLHLLRDNHQKDVVRPSAIKWTDPSIDFTATQQLMSSEKGSVVHQLLLIDHACVKYFCVRFNVYRSLICTYYSTNVLLHLLYNYGNQIIIMRLQFS